MTRPYSLPPFADSCLDRICGPYEQCVEDADGAASCVCQECDNGRGEDADAAASEAGNAEEDERVCGSDGITYFSLCHLQRASCTQGGQDIEALHRGPCGERDVKSDPSNSNIMVLFV